MLYSQPLFREVINDEDHENILSLALSALPQHGNGAVLTPKVIATTPSSSLACLCCALLCWGGWGDDDVDDDDPRGDDNAHSVRPHLPNTQQPAIAGGEGSKYEDNKEESKLGKGR
jgi:hypothetical protein